MPVTKTTHLRAGTTEPASFNEFCMQEKYWRAWPSTIALRDDPKDVNCRRCLQKLEKDGSPS